MNPNTNRLIVSIVSPKGGVGKTTIAANLATALAARGQASLLVDLDTQNSLRLHHQMPLDDTSGLAVQTLRGLPWSDCVYRSPYGIDCLPFGLISESDRREFEHRLDNDPTWLVRNLDALRLSPGSYVIVDTPPGGSAYLTQALLAADLAICVLLPDAASFITIPSMERWLDEYSRPRPDFCGGYYLLNRMNSARVLCRDVAAALERELGPRLIPVEVHFDSAVEEALASQTPILKYAPESPATRDLTALADWLLKLP
ncbi:MAG: cellulose synthase operon protein YhjQ [Nevskiaceae bacterium]|nr:MAG: cellulose synthase operon protein YhjQ [Nevskiaceae bacterium]TAM28819.1 MAG: cellulose synthase operon protein YhjQ [Nevskiaceae bacterium]